MIEFEKIVPTPHIGAQRDDFAKSVLMPGDPLRAKFVAEKYLDDAKLVTSIRGMLGYTGNYKGKRVSVMGSGVGMPSMCLYSYELFNLYDVDNIIRIGTAGALADEVNVKDIIVAIGACTDSNYVSQFDLPGSFAPIVSFELLEKAINEGKTQGIELKAGNVISTDIFYSARSNVYDGWREMGVLAAEMETAGLYMNAAKAKKNAISLLTASNHMYKHDIVINAEERERNLDKMIEIALEIA